MANSYFNYTDPVQPGDRIESFKYNNDFGAIAKAFDSLPSPEQLASNTSNYGVSTGTATAYQVSLPFFEDDFGYIEGMQVVMKAHITNTGPATVSVNGAAPVPMRNFHTGVGPTYALVAGDIAANAIYSLRYDGTYFQVVNTVATALTASQVAAQTANNAANNAQASASSASADRVLAQNAATTATNAQSAAAASASSAETSATLADNAADAAAGSATSASADAVTATNAMNNAAASAAAAAASATTAVNARNQAQSAATSAATNATAAANSATAAANSAAAAQAVLTDAAFKTAVLNYMYTTNLRVGTTKFYAANIDPNTLFPGTSWTRLPADYTIRTADAAGANVMTTAGSDNVTLSLANLPSHGHTGSVTINNYTFPSLTTSLVQIPTLATTAFGYDASTTSSYNFGTLSTNNNTASTVASSSAGAHQHNITVRTASSGVLGAIAGTTPAAVAVGATATDNVGAHTHSITFPAHNHTVTLGAHSHSLQFAQHSHQVVQPPHNHTVTVPNHTHTVTPTINNAGSGAQFSVRNKVLFLVGWRRTA